MRRLANITINKQKIWFPFTYFIKYYTDKRMCIFSYTLSRMSQLVGLHSFTISLTVNWLIELGIRIHCCWKETAIRLEDRLQNAKYNVSCCLCFWFTKRTDSLKWFIRQANYPHHKELFEIKKLGNITFLLSHQKRT